MMMNSKERFGRRICLHGGVCTEHLLPRGSQDEVYREARGLAGMMGEGGGYVLSPCHVLQSDVPTENILAMSQAGLDSAT